MHAQKGTGKIYSVWEKRYNMYVLLYSTLAKYDGMNMTVGYLASAKYSSLAPWLLRHGYVTKLDMCDSYPVLVVGTGHLQNGTGKSDI